MHCMEGEIIFKKTSATGFFISWVNWPHTSHWGPLGDCAENATKWKPKTMIHCEIDNSRVHGMLTHHLKTCSIRITYKKERVENRSVNLKVNVLKKSLKVGKSRKWFCEVFPNNTDSKRNSFSFSKMM